MTESPAMRRTRISNRKDVEPIHKLAGAVILMAVEDAGRCDADALAFLRGGGTAPFWFDAVTPDNRDPDEVRRTVLAMVEMGGMP